MSPAASDPSSNGPGPIRTALERASAPYLIRLSRLPRAVPFVVTLALAVVGLFIGGTLGFVIVAAALLIPGWLLFLSWPALPVPERLMRLAVLFVVLGLAAVTLIPR